MLGLKSMSICCQDIYVMLRMCVGIEVNEYLLSRRQHLRHVENVCWD